jgi:hypothetical protein
VSNILRSRTLKATLFQTVPYILRSSLFLAVNGSGFIGFLCLFRRLIGRFYFPLTAYAPAACASLCAILVERKNRRGLLTGYVFTLAVECLYRMFKYRGYITPIPYGEVMLFSAASAVLLPAYRSKQGLHDAIGSVLNVLFHPLYPKGVARFVESIRKGAVTKWRYMGYLTVRLALLSLWCYLVGYVTQVALGLLGSGTKVFKRWTRLKKVLFNWYNVRFGVFLAANIGGFKLLEVLLLLLPVGHNTRMTLAGLLAGLAMATVRSSAISLYAATKALEVVYFKAVKKGWARSCYYGDVILYSLSTALLFHTALFEAHNMRLSYWRFLVGVTNGRIGQLNWEEMDRFDTHSSLQHRTPTSL